jgi:hypothetical protein
VGIRLSLLILSGSCCMTSEVKDAVLVAWSAMVTLPLFLHSLIAGDVISSGICINQHTKFHKMFDISFDLVFKVYMIH